MELSVLEHLGLPDGGILSVRCGPTRRQSPLPCVVPFKLPAGPWPLRIDVLAQLGKSRDSASLSQIDADGRYVVPLEARDGRKLSVTLQVFDPKSGIKPKGSAEAPSRKRDTEAEARAYLDQHRLHEFMHALFELLLRERPDDPYTFMAARFRQAAQFEPRGPADKDAIADKPSKLSYSRVSTAPTSTPAPRADSEACTLPDGQVQVVVRNMRGRKVASMGARIDEKVIDVKDRLAKILGVPVASQHLLWWGETLPNETTLEEHGVPPSGASVHLAIGAREPKVTHALSGSSDGGIRLWNMRDGELIRDFNTGGSNAILSMSVHWESMRAFTGAFNGRLQLWDLNTGNCMLEMQGHPEEINAVEVDWTSMRALSGASDATAKLWNLENGQCVHTMQAGATVYTLVADWANSKACGGLRNGVVSMWDLATGAKLMDFASAAEAAKASGSAVSAVAIDCVGMRAISGLEDGHLVYWHLSDTRAASATETKPNPPKPKVLLAHYCAVRTITAEWKPEGSRALCGSDDGSLSLWRVDTSECLARFARHMGYVWNLYADWPRNRALSGAFDGCFKLWDLRNGDCLRTVQSHCRPVRSICGGGE